jgi:hypothetical protein
MQTMRMRELSSGMGRILARNALGLKQSVRLRQAPGNSGSAALVACKMLEFPQGRISGAADAFLP